MFNNKSPFESSLYEEGGDCLRMEREKPGRVCPYRLFGMVLDLNRV